MTLFTFFSFFNEKRCRYAFISCYESSTYKMYILHFHFPVRRTCAYRHKEAMGIYTHMHTEVERISNLASTELLAKKQ